MKLRKRKACLKRREKSRRGRAKRLIPPEIVAAKVPADIRSRYEVLSYRNAAVILAETRPAEFSELLDALRSFSINTEMIRRAGGNESEMPKLFSAKLRPQGWYETIIRGDLVTTLTWKEQIGTNKRGKPVYKPQSKGDAPATLFGRPQNRLCEKPRGVRPGMELKGSDV
jgi:hypothetical protein